MAGLLTDYSDPDELARFRSDFHVKRDNGTWTPQFQFEYAVCLIRSKNHPEIREGITMIEELSQNHKNSLNTYYLLYLTVGHAKIGEYLQALACVKKFLKQSPYNLQGKELKREIYSMLQNDGMKAAVNGSKAMSIVGGLVGLGMALMKK